MQAEIISDSWKVRLKLLRRDFKRHQEILKDIVEEQQNEQEENEQTQEMEALIDQICTIENYLEEIQIIISKTENFILHPETIRRISFLETEYYEMIISEEMASSFNQEINRQIDWNDRMAQLLRELEVTIDKMWDENKTESEMKERIYESVKDFYHSEQSSRHMTDNIYNAFTFEKNERVSLSTQQISEFQRMNNISGTCGVCLCDFSPEDEVLSLQPKCSHTYHPDCITPWLTRSVHCPSCRIDLR